jgi:hypothetical protein
MNFHVHFYPNDEGGYTCTVRALVNGFPEGPTLAIGSGHSQGAARDAALAGATNAEVQQALRSYVPDEWANVTGLPRLLQILGAVLVLGGAGHFVGVAHLYATQGVLDANRVLLDVWIGETQILGGGLYLAAFYAARAGRRWRGLAVCGAITIVSWAAPVLPVLFNRAPLMFRLPPLIYLMLSVWILAGLSRTTQPAAK